MAHLDGGGPHYHHKNGGENKQEEGKQDLAREFGSPFFSMLGPLDPETRSMGATSLDDTRPFYPVESIPQSSNIGPRYAPLNF
jgi:hypothetical protein